MPYFVYILFSKELNRFYIGQSINVEIRIKRHNSGFYNNASTKATHDWEIFWKLECRTRKQAIQIESHIKNMRNKTYYTNLKKYPEISDKLIEKYS